MNPLEAIEFEAHSRGAGLYRLVCPLCHGGVTKEASLSLYVEDTYRWSARCYRASCDTFWRSGSSILRTRRVKEPRYFTADTEVLTDERKEWFRDRFGFVPPDTVYAPTLDRYVYTVRSPFGEIRGRIARSFSGVVPKILTFQENFVDPFLAWTTQCGEADTPTLVVEDWISAEKVSEALGGNTVVALNGSHIGEAEWDEIATHQKRLRNQTVLALDCDAFPKALAYLRRYGNTVSPRVKVMHLTRDLKDESLNRIKALVEAVGYGDEHNYVGTENSERSDR